MIHEDIPTLETFKIVSPEPGVYILTFVENGRLCRKKITFDQLCCAVLDAVPMTLSRK